jgi:G3E family GTPase
LDRASLMEVIKSLPETVIRAKGIVQMADEPMHRVIFQLVGKRWDFRKGEAWADADEAPGTNLVLIGLPGSIPDELRERFKECLLK